MMKKLLPAIASCLPFLLSGCAALGGLLTALKGLTAVAFAKIIVVAAIILLILWLILQGIKWLINAYRTALGGNIAGSLPAVTGGTITGKDLNDLLKKLLDLWRAKARFKKESAEAIVGQLATLELILKELQDKQDLTDDEKERKKLLEELIERIRRLKGEWDELSKINGAHGLFGAPAPADADAEKRRHDALMGGLQAANDAQAKSDPELNALHPGAEQLKKDMTGKPVCLSPPADPCEVTEAISNVVFGNGAPLTIKPGCCIEFTFSPKLHDNWGNDVRIIAQPATAPMTVTAQEGRTSTPVGLKRDPKKPSEFNFPSWFVTYRSVRICNPGPSDLKLALVEGIG
jgi:hypothetical protein